MICNALPQWIRFKLSTSGLPNNAHICMCIQMHICTYVCMPAYCTHENGRWSRKLIPHLAPVSGRLLRCLRWEKPEEVLVGSWTKLSRGSSKLMVSVSTGVASSAQPKLLNVKFIFLCFIYNFQIFHIVQFLFQATWILELTFLESQFFKTPPVCRNLLTVLGILFLFKKE